jgi:predicted glycosyl hydrolase (DUF1957 family)
MKVELIESKPESEEIKYPILMQSMANGQIVLFLENQVGVLIVESNASSWLTGHYSDSWINATNKSVWQLFKGKIVLSNE